MRDVPGESWRVVVLAQLKKPDVVRVARTLGARFRPRDSKATIVEAAAGVAASPEAFLGALRRDDLREVCRGLHLQVSGRKPVLAERILTAVLPAEE